MAQNRTRTRFNPNHGSGWRDVTHFVLPIWRLICRTKWTLIDSWKTLILTNTCVNYSTIKNKTQSTNPLRLSPSSYQLVHCWTVGLTLTHSPPVASVGIGSHPLSTGLRNQVIRFSCCWTSYATFANPRSPFENFLAQRPCLPNL